MKLILINGPSGVGKTTLSYKLNEVLPMSFVYDFDKLRQFFGQADVFRKESRVMTFAIGFAITEECLKQSRDVIIGKGIIQSDKMQFQDDLIDKFIALGKKYNAEIYELYLNATKRATLERIKHRGYKIKEKLTQNQLDEYYVLAQETLKNRPNSTIIETSGLDSEEVFKKACEIIGLD